MPACKFYSKDGTCLKCGRLFLKYDEKQYHLMDGACPGVKDDPVNHPPHYTKHPSGVECIQVTEHMSFNLGNAVKYIWRAGDKGKLEEDLKKAIWYLEREIQRLK